jgi:hypothetical protein
MDALIKLSAALAEKYNIDPFGYTTYFKESKSYPYVQTNVNYNIA